MNASALLGNLAHEDPLPMHSTYQHDQIIHVLTFHNMLFDPYTIDLYNYMVPLTPNDDCIACEHVASL